MKLANRIHAIDALRGIALLGILLMNIAWFGMPEKAVEDLRVRGEGSGPNFWSWWIIEVFFHGTMRGMFSMLFGASAVLILEQYTKRNNVTSAAEYYFRRLVVLLLFGLFNAYILLWPGDILFTYAIAGMFIFPFYRLALKRLLLLAGFVMVFFSIFMTWQVHKPIRLKSAADAALAIDTLKTPLTGIQKADLEAWKSFEQGQSPEYKRKVDEDQIARTHSDFCTLFFYSAGVSHYLETKFLYNFFFLDAFGFMLIGIALFRMNVLSGKRSRRFYLILALAGYAIGFPIYYMMASTKVQCGFNPYQIALMTTVSMEGFGRLGLTLGNIALLNLLFQLPLTSWLVKLMAPVGRMAFTNYLMQSIIGCLLFSGFAFGLFNKLQRYELYYVVAAIWAFQILFSHLWMHIFTTGPFEWLWRSAARWEWQQFERVKLNKSNLA